MSETLAASLRRTFWALFGLAAIAAPLAAQGAGQQPRAAGASHSIRGKIFMPSGRSSEQRMRVALEVSTGGMMSETFSDSVGNFEFRAISNGNYILKVPSDGRAFEPVAEQLEVSGSFARTFTPHIYLRERAADPRDKPNNRLLSVADTQEVPKEARKIYEKGLKLAQANQPQPAIAQLQAALKVFSDYLHALNKLGEQHLQLGQRDDARAYYERAIAVNTRFAAPHIGMGMLLVEQQQYAAAIAHLEAANQSDDSFPVAHIQLGLALMENTPPAYARAEKELTRGLALGGKDVAYVYMHLFNLHLRQRKYAEAAAQLDGYLRDKPDASEAPQVRARLEALKKIMAQPASPKP